ncbi:unnamed protein product [Peniophora sp. CBMAI 1063]|nr:unnamed protein product [Peniophora sp. CBMAI 1063]
MHDINIVYAFFLSAWLVGPLYGLNLILFVLCLRFLLNRGVSGGNRVLLATTAAQILLCTGHLVTTIVQIFRAISLDEEGRGILDNAYVYNQSEAAHVVQVTLYITNGLFADGILIWRCYVVWNKSVYIWAPLVFLLAGNGITGYIAMAHLSRLTPQTAVFDNSVGLYIQATWSLSIATQVIASLLISWKVLAAGARLASNRSRPRFRGYHATIFWTIVESGALYSFTTVLLLVFYVNGAQAGAICAAILGQLSATAPYLILVRVEHNRQHIPKQTSTVAPPRHYSRQTSIPVQPSSIPVGLVASTRSNSFYGTSKSIGLQHEDVDVMELKHVGV